MAATATPPRKGNRKTHRHTKSNTTDSRHTFEGNDTDGDRTGSDNYQNPVKSQHLPMTPKAPSGSHSNVDLNGVRSESPVGGKKRKARQKNKPKEYSYDSGQDNSHAKAPQSIPQPTPPHSRPLPTPVTDSTTPAQSAYAGPTFHASPAPSALPIPSFFSKSVPESASQGLQDRLDAEYLDSGADSPTPEKRRLPEIDPAGSESPLDLFFKADREQKARARELEVAQNGRSSPFSRDGLAGSSPFRGQSESPFGDLDRDHSSQSIGRSSGAMFTLDMDSTRTPTQPYGPSFSTPFNERISAARAESAPSTTPASGDNEELKRQATTKALKDLLFASPSQRPATSSARFGASQEPDGYFDSPSPSPHHQSKLTNPETSSYMPQQSPRPAHHQQLPRESQTRNSASFKAASRASGLRKEVKASTGSGLTKSHPIQHELDPNQVARRFLETQFPSNKSDQTASRQPFSGTIAAAAQDGTRAAGPDVKSMEDNLRRMLNLE